MNCQQAPLLEFLRADTEVIRTEEVLRHLEECGNCRERLQVVVALEALYSDQLVRRRLPGGWLIAATLLLVSLIPLVYHNWLGVPAGPASLASLATQEKYPCFPLLTRSSTLIPHSRNRAFEAYNAGDFKQAEDWFAKLIADGESLFYQGVTQYFLGRHSDALNNLEKAVQMDARWKVPALWYEANILLKTGRKDEAEKALTHLARSQNEYREKARKLLSQLMND